MGKALKCSDWRRSPKPWFTKTAGEANPCFTKCVGNPNSRLTKPAGEPNPWLTCTMFDQKVVSS